MPARSTTTTIGKETSMFRKAVPLLLALALAGCAGNKHKLTAASGPYRPLNAGKWTPTKDDLRGPRAPLAPVDSPNAAPPQAPAGAAANVGGKGL